METEPAGPPPISPPSGPTQWLFQGPPAESKLLAVVDLMKQRIRQAGEDKVRRVLLKLSALVEGEDPLRITRGRIVGFKARKDAEFAGGTLEETLVGDWPDVGFIKLSPDDKEGPGAREEPKLSATEPKGGGKPH